MNRCFGAASAKDRLDVVIRDAINAGDIPGPRYLANGKEMARRVSLCGCCSNAPTGLECSWEVVVSMENCAYVPINDRMVIL